MNLQSQYDQQTLTRYDRLIANKRRDILNDERIIKHLKSIKQDSSQWEELLDRDTVLLDKAIVRKCRLLAEIGRRKVC